MILTGLKKVMKTEYKVAETDKDFEGCRKLIDGDEQLSPPTVMAVRNGEVIGLISTSCGKDSIFAAPMVSNSVFTSIGLYELYEKVLRKLGVDHYLFTVEKVNKRMIEAVERLFNIKPFGGTDEFLFYARRI